jgi:hypothetical protein
MSSVFSHLESEAFRFLIKRDRDGRHGWYLYNASGTVVGMHTVGFPSELEAYENVERVREEIAVVPIVGESEPERAIVGVVPVDGAAGRPTGHQTGGGR